MISGERRWVLRRRAPAFSGVAARKRSGGRLPLARVGGRGLDFVYRSIENGNVLNATPQSSRPLEGSLMIGNAAARTPLRAYLVGSLLRPSYLRQAFTHS